jgi:hypothetical protein
MKTNVKKRDGEYEAFDPKKIEAVAMAAGMTGEEANELLLLVMKWFSTLKGDEISSLAIRDKIVELMPKINKYAADAYISYEHYKDKELK